MEAAECSSLLRLGYRNAFKGGRVEKYEDRSLKLPASIKVKQTKRKSYTTNASSRQSSLSTKLALFKEILCPLELPQTQLRIIVHLEAIFEGAHRFLLPDGARQIRPFAALHLILMALHQVHSRRRM